MNQKMIMAIAAILIVVGVIGIFSFSSSTPEPVAVTESPSKASTAIQVTYAIAQRDMPIGHIITDGDYRLETFAIEPEKMNQDKLDVGQMQIHQYLVIEPVVKGKPILMPQISKPGSASYLNYFVSPGYHVYSFNLDERQSLVLQQVKAGGYVDLFLRYQYADKSYKTPILQSRPKGTYASNTNIDYNQNKLIPFLLKRKLIYTDMIISAEQSSAKGAFDSIKAVAQKETEVKEQRRIFIELSDADLKFIYTVESYGEFLFFPAVDVLSPYQAISTQDSLPEYIRQLRGVSEQGR